MVGVLFSILASISALSLPTSNLKSSAFFYGFFGVVGMFRSSHHSVYKEFGYKVETDSSALLEEHMKDDGLESILNDNYTPEELERDDVSLYIAFSEKKTCRTINRGLGESNLTESKEANLYREHTKIRKELGRFGICREPPLKEGVFKLRVWREKKRKCNLKSKPLDD
ncbi:MAG: hypothetical protein PHH26_02845 [Candidatus Thermoplasmatota archaeon]|nr:hypothetical protein [Candidatus Thermoplasmatota archaeon]